MLSSGIVKKKFLVVVFVILLFKDLTASSQKMNGCKSRKGKKGMQCPSSTQPTPVKPPVKLPTKPPTSAVVCYTSCKSAYDAGQQTSKIFQLCPSGDANAASFSAYCDQVTDGGGWMLFFSYHHVSGESKDVVIGTLPTDPINGYSHVNLNNVSGWTGWTTNKIQEVRLYCETTSHGRKIDFKTNNTAVKKLATTGDQNGLSIAAWQTGYTTLPDHTGFLPASADSTNGEPGLYTTGGLWFYPFFQDGKYYWTVDSIEQSYQCDDASSNGIAPSTLHTAWAKIL